MNAKMRIVFHHRVAHRRVRVDGCVRVGVSGGGGAAVGLG